MARYGAVRFDRVVLVGGGAIPYTALFARLRLNKPTFVIERNVACYLACLLLLRRLNLSGSIHVVRGDGERYSGYAHSLVIVPLHMCNKQEIVDCAMRGRGNVVVVRQPTAEYAGRLESVRFDAGCTRVHHKTKPPLTSVFMTSAPQPQQPNSPCQKRLLIKLS
jgi:hypothetical protein